MAGRLRRLGNGILSGGGRRRWRAIGQQMTVVMGLLFSVVLVQSLAGASTEVIMEAPYNRSGADGNAAADHNTGVIGVSAVLTGSSKGWIEVDHDLASEASSIEYTITLNGDGIRALAEAHACVGGYCSAPGTNTVWINPFNPRDTLLRFTLEPAGGIPSGASVTVRVTVNAGAEPPAVCVPLPFSGCDFNWLVWHEVWGASANGVVRVASITATPNSGDSEPTPTPTTPFELKATGYKDKGLQKADLTWTGASSSVIEIDVYRNGVVIATTKNDGAYTDHIDQRGKGTYTYLVCEAGTATCSNEATVEF